MIEYNSPCISICKVKDGLCIGCGRTLKEIASWTAMTREQRQEILGRIKRDKTNNI
tara:strand:+ start:2195 stop:2362 length:168 start_codon:yes stop_codon:yes gene_type:complete